MPPEKEDGEGQVVRGQESDRVTLKTLAECVGLTAGTVSAVLNNTRQAQSIPQQTKGRIRAAAHELNYQPNFFARSLRNRKSYTIGVMAREIADSQVALVLSGIEHALRKQDYFFIIGVHNNDPALLENCSRALMQRSVEGLVIMDLSLAYSSPLPTVQISVGEQFSGDRSVSIRGCDSRDVSFIRKRLEGVGNNAANNLLDQIRSNQ